MGPGHHRQPARWRRPAGRAHADDQRPGSKRHHLFTLHPWIAEASTSRPPLGPGLMAKYEHELQAFEGLGLDDVEMDAALTFLLGFVQAAACSAAARQDSAMSEEQWWAANAPMLARVFDQAKYPTASRVGAAAGAAHGA